MLTFHAIYVQFSFVQRIHFCPTAINRMRFNYRRCVAAPIINTHLLWIIVITILFSIPPNELAGWSIIIMALFMFIYWQADAKKRPEGPTPADEVEVFPDTLSFDRGGFDANRFGHWLGRSNNQE
jgi:hypothetical protein